MRKSEMSSEAQSATAPPDKATRESEILRRLIDHWFGPRAYGWGVYRRLVFALAGGATFFLAWSVHIVGSTGVALVPDLFAATLLIMTVVGVLGAVWFAGLTAWKDLNYGPVRLYLSGFLLPYLVWSLVVFMLNRELPGLAQ